MVGVDDLPLEVESLHGPVDLAHDVVRLGLAEDGMVLYWCTLYSSLLQCITVHGIILFHSIFL